jgi:hypothetical protein
MKSIGLYVDQLNNADAFKALSHPEISQRDKSLFFETVGPKPDVHMFGVFSSCEILNFDGTLAVTFLEGLKFASRSCNSKSIFYFYEADNKDLLGLLSCLENKNVFLVCRDADVSELQRKTGQNPVLVCENLEELMISLGAFKW